MAAVSQTSSRYWKTGGGISIGAALAGNVPGLITAPKHGITGEEDPQLIIRGKYLE